MEFRHPPGLARTFPHQMRVAPRADVGVDLPELRAPRIHRQPEDVRRDHPEAAIGDGAEPIGSPLAVARGLPLEPLPACLGCLGHWRTLRPGARSHGVTRSHRGLSPGHGPRVRNDRLRTGQTWRVRACARGACDLGHAPAPAYDGLLASGYGRGMPMHTEPGRACRRRTASCSLPSAIECAACPPQGRWWATDDGFGLGGEHEAFEHGGRRDGRAVLAAILRDSRAVSGVPDHIGRLEAPLHRLGAVVHATTFDGAAVLAAQPMRWRSCRPSSSATRRFAAAGRSSTWTAP